MREENAKDYPSDYRVIRPFEEPLKTDAGFVHLKGSLFDSGIMKVSVISDAFHQQYLENPNDPMAFEGPVAVFDGPEEYHRTIEERPEIAAGTILIMRGAGPKGYPGAAEVVNMIPPGRLIRQGIEVSSSWRLEACIVRELELTSSCHVSGTAVSPGHLAPPVFSTLRLKPPRAVC